jgi:NTP pyrophosphatase (non-canonical NTP hydrolase)
MEYNISINKIKLLEELAELQEVLTKSVTRPGYEAKIIEELGDVKARIELFCKDADIAGVVDARMNVKLKKIASK